MHPVTLRCICIFTYHFPYVFPLLFLCLSLLFPILVLRHKLVRHGTRFGHLHGVLAGMQGQDGSSFDSVFFFFFFYPFGKGGPTGRPFRPSSPLSICPHAGGAKRRGGVEGKTLLVVVFGLDTTFLISGSSSSSQLSLFSSSLQKPNPPPTFGGIGLDGV